MRFLSIISAAVCRAAQKAVSHPGWQKALKYHRSFFPNICGLNDSLLLFNTDPVTVFNRNRGDYEDVLY